MPRRSLYAGLVIAACTMAPAVAAPPHAVPHFEPTACDGVPDIADILPRLRCGVVRVPRDHAHPDGASFALAVTLVASAQQPARPDPVLYISGGPGSPLTIYTGYQARHPYAADRDLILVDQRGMGRSEPHLCPGRQARFTATMLAVVAEPSPAALSTDYDAHIACRDDMLAHGIDPDAFGTAITTEDLDWVRQALDLERWNIVGESYGTTVALNLLARHPATIRSAVLDSLNPPDAYLGPLWPVRMASARDAFFAATAPGLADAYRTAAATLEHDPPALAVPPALELPGNQIRLTPSLFEEIVDRMTYYPTFYATLPHVVTATRDGNLVPIQTALNALLTGAATDSHQAALAAVECRDRPRWREPRRAADSAGDSALDLAVIPPGVCAAWSSLGPEPEVPHDTPVPTLILAGQFDPNIRPPQSRAVAERLGPNARWILFAGIGHNVRHFSPCAERLVAAFIDAPGAPLDAACAALPR